MSTAMLTEVASRPVQVRLRQMGRRCEVIVEGKNPAVELRCELVRRGYGCTYPQPTWHRGDQAFYVSLGEATSAADLQRVLAGIEGIQSVTEPAATV